VGPLSACSVGNNISNIGLAIFLAIQYGQSGQYYCNIHQNSQYNIGISKSWQYNRALSNIVPHTAIRPGQVLPSMGNNIILQYVALFEAYYISTILQSWAWGISDRILRI
jgi:hypothetical protein